MVLLPTEADIVIVGGGTAGCVLANRLSADPAISVVLLEAGKNRSDDPRMYTPARSTELLGDEGGFDWAFKSKVEPGLSPFPTPPDAASVDGAAATTMTTQNGDGFGAEARDGRRMLQPRGKVVGGSSAINSFALIYPSATELDAWAEFGNAGWDWQSIKENFRRFQTLVRPSKDVINALNLSHNFDSGLGMGPIHGSFPLTVSPVQKAWLEAFRTVGLENVEDPLEGHAIGGAITACHIDGDTRERSHAGVAYLAPVRSRTNLKVVTGALVKRVGFEKLNDGSPAVARKVVYEKGGQVYEVSVRKEVVLAAGAFASPQLLELSGIGDAGLLGKHGIDVVHSNSAVGENLQDHIRAGLSFEAAEGVASQNPLSWEEAQRLYEEDRSGPWAESASYMFAYMPLVPFMSTSEIEELKRLCHDYLDDSSGTDLSPLERKRNAFLKDTLLSPTEASATAYLIRKCPVPLRVPGLESGECITLAAMLSHPLSRGSVHITFPDAALKPDIKFNYYTHPLDLEIHARHLFALQQLSRTRALRSIIKEGGARYPDPPTLDSLDTVKAFLKANATTNYHPCGTCAMLPEAMGGVVDEKMRVYGTSNVRVVDASVFPIIPRGNIVSTVYAVAEKGAEILREEMGLEVGRKGECR